MELKFDTSSIELIAKHLIKERFILTALEFHTELVEHGHELPHLRDYFSNPSNFEQISIKSISGESTYNVSALNKSSSQTTLDSLDWARFSEDGERLLDDRIAVLEFELRKARETIQGLRDNLTQVTALNEESKNINLSDKLSPCESKGSNDLRPHEVCTLNFLINEYLVIRNYKMTANTFADENANQDFENWDDVGLNIPRPPTLAHWFQDKFPRLAPTTCISCQTDNDDDVVKLQSNEEEIIHLKEKVSSLESLCERQELELEKLRKKNSLQQVKTLASDQVSNGNIEDNDLTITMMSTSTNTDVSLFDDVSCQIISEHPKASEMENYLSSNVESIEDMLESSTINENLEQQMDVSANTAIDESQVVTDAVDNSESEEYNDIVLNQSKLSTSDSCDMLDPTKCDRLPPLGASSEYPQAILSGEFLTAQRDEALNLLRRSTSRDTPSYLEHPIMTVCYEECLGVHSRLQNQVLSLSLGQCNLLNLVCTSLHNIAPNVILAKREELLPLLVYCITEHLDATDREKLLHLLFNLTKRPDKEQRSTILLGLLCLARVLGPERLESELLPQCWEQLSHKHPERRLLVAQSVALLSPYTPAHLRNSLLFSMLLQLLSNESDEDVQETAFGSLALLVLYMDDTEKIASLILNLIKFLERNPKESSNLFLLYSSLASWCLEDNKMKIFIEPQLKRMHTLAKDLSSEIENSGKRSNIDQLEHSLTALLKGLSSLCPLLLLNLYETLTMKDLENFSDDALTLSNFSTSSIIEELNLILKDEDPSAILGKVHFYWKNLFLDEGTIYLTTDFIHDFLESIACINSEAKAPIKEIMNFVSRFSSCIGHQATKELLFRKLSQYLTYDRNKVDIVRRGMTAHTKVPFIISVHILSQISSSESVQEYLAKHIIFLSVCDASMNVLQTTFELWLEEDSCEDIILSALWACIVHEKSCVRIATALLWTVLVQYVRESKMSSRIIPALVTLATDPDVQVRASAICPLSTVLSSASSNEILDKVMLQLECICEESQVLEHVPLQLAIAQCCKTLGHTVPASLLHSLFLPRLCRSVLDGRGSPEEKLKFGYSVLDAFAALDSSSMPNHVVAHFILPPLNQLQKTLGAMSYDHMETITVLTKEYTLRAQVAHQPMSYNLGSASAALGEDVKNKMSKIFASKSSVLPRKASINSFFKKK